MFHQFHPHAILRQVSSPRHFEASFFRVHFSTAWLVAQERRQNDGANDYAHHDAQLRHVGKLQANMAQMAVAQVCMGMNGVGSNNQRKSQERIARQTY